MNATGPTNSGFLGQVTPIVLTYNEEPNIERCLSRLTAFNEVLVVDSGSTDATLHIISRFPNTRVITRRFDSFSGQWNFAIREGDLRTEWVLAMDADYVLTGDFIHELAGMQPDRDDYAFKIGFDYCVFGRKLSSTLYPPIVALYRHAHTHYIQDGHCMRACTPSASSTLNSKVLHDDRKPLDRWLSSQVKYADQEAELLLSKTDLELRFQDRLRKLIFVTPWLVPLYFLTIGRGLFDGWSGLHYALQRSVAESILSLRLIERRLTRTPHANKST